MLQVKLKNLGIIVSVSVLEEVVSISTDSEWTIAIYGKYHIAGLDNILLSKGMSVISIDYVNDEVTILLDHGLIRISMDDTYFVDEAMFISGPGYRNYVFP